MNRKRLILICFCFLSALSFTGCKKNEAEIPTTEVQQETEEATEEVNREGQMISRLTGLWVDEEIGMKRPIAVMINNIKIAIPQSGISNADIVYEALVEGGITRLMGIFEDYQKLEKIGSVRSARHYYVEIANEYDGIFTHYGQTKYAVSEIKARDIPVLNAESELGNTIFYRDSSRKAPHNAYTSEEGILFGLNKKQYRTEYEEDYKGHFLFHKEKTPLKGEAANKVTLDYSSYSSPWFEYDKETGLYKRFQYGDKHIDDQTGEQLVYQNIIVQFVKEWDIDKNGYQTMELSGSGNGFYITNGSYIPITWKKESSKATTRYYDDNKEEISLNPGKTWVSVFPNHKTSNVTFQ